MNRIYSLFQDSDDEVLPRIAAPVWSKKQYTPPDTTFSGPVYTIPDDMTDPRLPYQYFKEFIPDELLVEIAEQTNIYSIQKRGICVNTSKKELEQCLGIYFRMGLCQMPGTRCYWERATAYPLISHVMPRNRFRLLLTVIHCVDNMSATEETKKDKIWKVRPVVDCVRKNCPKIIPEEHNAIDEMMVAFKGTTSQIRQYVKGKPHPWGFKIWVRSGVSGMVYDFEVYQGGTGIRTELGQGPDVIIKLCSTLQSQKNYKIFADNPFTSMPLIPRLLHRGMHYTGTLRKNRGGKLKLKSEKELKKEGRGASDCQVDETCNIAGVCWYDNKVVTLVSSYVAVEPQDGARRWDKTQKDYRVVPRPAIVKAYNQFMGGIDLMDSFLAKYRYKLKSRRWPMYLFWHMMNLSLVNAWLLYRRDCGLLGVPEKDRLLQRQFQSCVAESLVLVESKKRRRPSIEDPNVPFSPAATRRRRVAPVADVRKDQTGHWPIKVEKRGRCMHCEKNQTTTLCEKCNMRLCFVETRNCFRAYHM